MDNFLRGLKLLISVLNFFILVKISPFYSLTAKAVEYTQAEYPFPIKDPALATVLGALNSPTLEFKSKDYFYRSERASIDSLPSKARVQIHFLKQSRLAPLLIVIGGLGANSGSGNSLSIAETFYKKGYNVLSLPNNVSWQYSLAVSEKGHPGFAPTDAPEYYQFIKWVLLKMKTEQGMNFNQISLLGYSNGGLLSGFLAHHDKLQAQPLFKKIILVNPAFDVIFGIQQLDTYGSAGSDLSADYKDFIRGSLLNEAPKILKSVNPIQEIQKFIRVNNITPNLLKWFIGDSFKSSLRDIILTSQAIEDRQAFTSDSYSIRAQQALSYNFQSYMKKLVIPYLPESYAHQDITFITSLYSQFAALKSDSRVFIITNTDDFITKPSDLNLLRSQFKKEHFYLFPYGGHCGNMLTEQHKALYLKLAQ